MCHILRKFELQADTLSAIILVSKMDTLVKRDYFRTQKWYFWCLTTRRSSLGMPAKGQMIMIRMMMTMSIVQTQCVVQ